METPDKRRGSLRECHADTLENRHYLPDRAAGDDFPVSLERGDDGGQDKRGNQQKFRIPPIRQLLGIQ